jgi:DNA-binding response OmpR family regulator
MSKARLEQKIYGWNEEVESNTVDVYVHRLRKKLGQDFIRNVRGVGYLVSVGA